MSDYTHKDFGPIHQPENKPKKRGWYVTTEHLFESNLRDVHRGAVNPRHLISIFQFWNGKSWLRKYGRKCREQNLHWFGLKEKAK